MIHKINFDLNNFAQVIENLKTTWKKPDLKVFVLSPNQKIESPKNYYESKFPHLGKPFALGEDVTRGDRGIQRTGDIWFQVRYDSQHPDAYRHSSQAQPLHTDGSYIPSYPSSTILICEAAASEGGATTFINNIDVANALRDHNHELYEFVTTTKIYHERSGDETYDFIINPENDYRINYNFYCISQSKNLPEHLNKINLFQEFLLKDEGIKQATIPVKLMPGEAVFWKDDRCLHGRNSFNPKIESERFIWKCAIDILP